MRPAADFANISLPGYRNINELVSLDDQLHICETLFGDPNAEVMVLAQDAANFDTMRSWHARHGRKGICHNDRLPTNKNLINAFSPFLSTTGDGWTSRNCRIFYANAIWLLKDSEGMSSTLPSPETAAELSLPILKATIEGLPSLKLIVTLGEQAYRTVRALDPSLSPDWRSVRTEKRVQECYLYTRIIRVGTVYHMGSRGSQARVKQERATSGRDLSAASLFREDVDSMLRGAGLL